MNQLNTLPSGAARTWEHLPPVARQVIGGETNLVSFTLDDKSDGVAIPDLRPGQWVRFASTVPAEAARTLGVSLTAKMQVVEVGDDDSDTIVALEVRGKDCRVYFPEPGVVLVTVYDESSSKIVVSPAHLFRLVAY